MRALNSLTQNLIDNLTQILQNPEEDALQTLRICAPVLIEEPAADTTEGGRSPRHSPADKAAPG